MLLEYIQIFLIGILEDFLSSFNAKTIQRNNQLSSFVVSFISVILWYYVIIKVVDNIYQFWFILIYALGGGLGDIITIKFDKQIQRFEMMITKLFKFIRFRWPIEFNFKRRKKRKATRRKRKHQKDKGWDLSKH